MGSNRDSNSKGFVGEPIIIRYHSEMLEWAKEDIPDADEVTMEWLVSQCVEQAQATVRIYNGLFWRKWRSIKPGHHKHIDNAFLDGYFNVQKGWKRWFDKLDVDVDGRVEFLDADSYYGDNNPPKTDPETCFSDIIDNDLDRLRMFCAILWELRQGGSWNSISRKVRRALNMALLCAGKECQILENFMFELSGP
jgi:hypothetical protein